MVYTESFSIHPLVPFNFDLTADIFHDSDPQIRSYANGIFSQVLRVNEKFVLVEVSSVGSVEQPYLTNKVKSNAPISSSEKTKVRDMITFIFNLNFSLTDFYSSIRDDPVMSYISSQLFGLKNPTTVTVFESLIDSIVEQQISIKVAHQIEMRLTKKFGEVLTLYNNTFYAYPTPESIAASNVAEVQKVGLSGRKAEYIHGAAKLIAEGKLDIEGLKKEPKPERIIEVLDEVKGVGVWTAELTMLRGMHKLDSFPADDFGIQRVISRYYCEGKPIKAAKAREIAELWGNWKGLAAFYLIIAEAKDIRV
jgi:DNA-3-methyladenine glycosylase II